MSQPALFPATQPAWCFVCRRVRTDDRPAGGGRECLEETP